MRGNQNVSLEHCTLSALISDQFNTRPWSNQISQSLQSATGVQRRTAILYNVHHVVQSAAVAAGGDAKAADTKTTPLGLHHHSTATTLRQSYDSATGTSRRGPNDSRLNRKWRVRSSITR